MQGEVYPDLFVGQEQLSNIAFSNVVKGRCTRITSSVGRSAPLSGRWHRESLPIPRGLLVSRSLWLGTRPNKPHKKAGTRVVERMKLVFDLYLVLY